MKGSEFARWQVVFAVPEVDSVAETFLKLYSILNVFLVILQSERKSTDVDY